MACSGLLYCSEMETPWKWDCVGMRLRLEVLQRSEGVILRYMWNWWTSLLLLFLSSCCCCILGSCAAPADLPHALYNLVCMKALDILSFFFFSIFFFLSSSDICMLFKIALLFTTTPSASWRLPNVLLLEKMLCLFSLALLADTLGAVAEGWGDLFPCLSVKEGGMSWSWCAVWSRGWRNRASVFIAGALLGALVGCRSKYFKSKFSLFSPWTEIVCLTWSVTGNSF